MFLQHMWGVIYDPKHEWRDIRKEHYSMMHCFLSQISILAAIPALSLFIGTTQIGWSISGGEFVKLSIQSAMMAAVAFYVAMWIGVGFIAYVIHWMERTYGGKASLDDCMVLATFTATPMFMAGIVGLYPVLWLNVIVGMVALAYTVYLLFTGVPEIMQIPEDRAFFFASSILTVGLCVLVGLLAVTVIMWSTVIPLNYVGG
ncbi:Yip1 family protein [Amphritea pacifica]|uniref:YIP1 family protein n=1 Tax=Amphritea pacifica TaxID=2811233 RepID=A0ABS2WDH4_9GAMM|nr:Yip1 family protein [Amphritea pacifica]MBN0989685.1 YIP1 family protein [Amphritea pacifica]MBN1008958.1 YIP1 family protein [Amphritea pacifica]